MNVDYSGVILTFTRHRFHRNHIFGIIVFNFHQIPEFPFLSLFRTHYIGDLNIYSLTTLGCDKINFSCSQYANCDIESLCQKM